MTKIIIDENNKVIDHIETTWDMKIVEDIPTEPEAKVGKINVKYYNPDTQKIEWRQEDRPLTVEEQLSKLKEEQETNSQAIQELALAGMGGA